ncbi:hypothetical protein DAH55_00285 [Sphingomonas koreensis]|uniref:hypothetical protein n=1 Tax=Sphingomonas koreensis TaxID=93064 RepID=UPI00082A94B5|nr:hypothetical protein [Sphingomonas koreensis]PJI87439.1 hypothetical protein BDW16_0675 [Sphingomonas koreensis]RSU62826.1 hypothetical protein DAH56_02650 [Sphingomonas koreensis]RSU71537.1 hypothetical protein DAH55_00285 [Sphingomonas koreensis]
MSDPNASGPAQLGFDLGDAAAPDSYLPDVEEVRAELLEILSVARAAEDVSPWDERTFRYHRTVFPQMARWLPDDERDQLCFEFARAADHIELLLAA